MSERPRVRRADVPRTGRPRHRPGRPGGLARSPHGTEAYLDRARAARAPTGTRAAASASDRAVQGITIYPPTGGVQTQGDPFEPVKIGILIDMDLNQLLADWIDPTILAIEDALNEGVCSRGPIQLVIADARGLPRENYRKVIDGYRWLVEQGCVVVLGPMISDNSLVLQDTANELGVAVHRLDRRPQVRLRVLLHRGQRRHPHRGRHVRAVAGGQGHHARSARSGSRGRRAATTPTTSATPPASLGLDRRARGEARAQPQGPAGRPAP